MIWYEVQRLKVKAIKHPAGYLATARINGVYVERYYWYKPAREQVLDELTKQYQAQQHAQRLYYLAGYVE